MSGHSKWSTIKRQKGVTDAKRGNLFTKLSNVIAIAVREGAGVEQAIEKAKEANMPKDKIQQSVDRGLGKGQEENLETAIFEGFGPGGVAIIVETITDNTTRTASELRNLFEKHGGHLGVQGSVAYMFTRLGEIEIGKSDFDKAVEAGASDFEETEDGFLVYTKPEDLHRVGEILGKSGNLIYRPNKGTLVQVSEPEIIGDFIDTVHELDDVQEVYLNCKL